MIIALLETRITS